MRRSSGAAAAAGATKRRRSAPSTRLRPTATLLLLAALLAAAAAPARAAAGLLQETYSLGTVASLPLPLSGKTPTATAIVPTLNCPLGANCFPAPVQAVFTGGCAPAVCSAGSDAACHCSPVCSAVCPCGSRSNCAVPWPPTQLARAPTIQPPPAPRRLRVHGQQQHQPVPGVPGRRLVRAGGHAAVHQRGWVGGSGGGGSAGGWRAAAGMAGAGGRPGQAGLPAGACPPMHARAWRARCHTMAATIDMVVKPKQAAPGASGTCRAGTPARASTPSHPLTSSHSRPPGGAWGEQYVSGSFGAGWHPLRIEYYSATAGASSNGRPAWQAAGGGEADGDDALGVARGASQGGRRPARSCAPASACARTAPLHSGLSHCPAAPPPCHLPGLVLSYSVASAGGATLVPKQVIPSSLLSTTLPQPPPPTSPPSPPQPPPRWVGM